jgi:ribosome biogenesis protein SSF1/2
MSSRFWSAVMQGPTAVLKIVEFSYIRDVLAAQKHARLPEKALQHPPLVVLQGFGGEQHMKLVAVLFQNMFPAINVTKAKLSECQVCCPASGL